MCLLAVAFRVVPGAPLLIGANRDEFLNRPAVPMTVLRAGNPVVLGGRDEQSGGTWLAVNEHGVFAGLTNQPLGEARDPTRRTRGELPLALASHTNARSAVDAFVACHDPSSYNGSWLLAGDRDALFFIDFTGLVDPRPVGLAPGLHVLENRPLGAPSAKAERVAGTLGTTLDAEGTVSALRQVLADHAPDPSAAAEGGPKSSSTCVHLEDYGTRSSCIIRCGDDPAVRPRIWAADGPPCTAPFVDVSALWSARASLPL
jgi:uncharacterized protein with NRDE domain